MLLGRTASGLYWMHRYIERAENIARVVDAGLRMALTRTADAPATWASVVATSGMEEGFRQRHEICTADTVSDYLLCDIHNPSSVLSCIEAARSNARMVRTALTRESWESVNEAWMVVRRLLATPVQASALPAVLNRIKREAAQMCGTFQGTMLRNEIFNFARIGTFIERADNTARILDVKYHLLLPAVSYVGTTLDNHQWESMLRSVDAHRSYRWVYDAQYKPANIADYLILNSRMPRSLSFCYVNLVVNLGYLAQDYGVTHLCQKAVNVTLATLKDNSVKYIFAHGLHEFLADFITQNNRLGFEIAEAYNFE
jgi:uncharacterized alpha-E superfamily protein